MHASDDAFICLSHTLSPYMTVQDIHFFVQKQFLKSKLFVCLASIFLGGWAACHYLTDEVLLHNGYYSLNFKYEVVQGLKISTKTL